MKLNFGSDFTILRVVGVFISLMIVHRVYEIMQSYSPGSMAVLSPVDILILFISIFIVIYCFTMYWKVELIHDSIVSSYGFCLWHKKKAYQNISQIKFEVNFIEVKNGPDKAYISVTIKPEKETGLILSAHYTNYVTAYYSSRITRRNTLIRSGNFRTMLTGSWLFTQTSQ